MRIDLNYGPQATNETAGRSTHSSAIPEQASEALGEDQAHLSRVPAQIQALTEQASQLPEIREQRVQALRLAVESGRYRPASEHVAAAIISEMTAGPAA